MAIMDDEEEYFPRGGSSKNQKKSLKSDRSYVFETKKPQTVIRKKLGRRERLREKAKRVTAEDEELGDEELNELHDGKVLEPFVYKNITDGTLSMCCVWQIRPNFLLVSLPERKIAKIPKDLICPSFNNLNESLDKEPALKDYFSLGQCLLCRIVENEYSTYNKVIATVDPSMIYHNVPFSQVSPGFTLIAAVQSREDHGYMMDTGIKGLTAFLPNSKTGDNSKELGIGQLIWCKVKKCIPSETSNLATLTTIPEKVSGAILKRVTSPEVLVPGVKVIVVVEEVASRLLYVKELSSGIKGYVHVSHLEQMWSKTSDYHVGEEYLATVLYKFPHVNVVCYSMKVKIDKVSLPRIRLGTLFESARIISNEPQGVLVKLENEGESYKGLINTFNLRKTLEEESVDNLFPVGNSIKVRVINFNNLDEVYACTTSDEVLKKYGHISDFKVGQLVKVKISSRSGKGINGLIGNVNVFIPMSEISDELSSNPDKRLNNNSLYTGRIMSICETSAIVTLRPLLVKNKPLTDYTNLNVGDAYFGKVHKIESEGILVTFFNDIIIRIPENNLPKLPKKYRAGELVKCFVLKSYPDKKPYLSVTKPLGTMTLLIGSYYDIIVKTISDNGLDCLILENKQPIDCILPLHHLCDCLKLCPAFLKKYEIGQKIKAILYTFDEQKPVFSLRYSVATFFKNNQIIKEEGFSRLSPGNLLPATISGINGNSMLLDVPIPNYNGKLSAKIPAELKNILKINQGITVMVQEVDVKNKFIAVKFGVNEFNFRRKELVCFLNELSKLQTRKSGTEITAKVVSKEDNIIKVSLITSDSDDNNSEGIITIHCAKQFHVGEVLETILLYEDPIKNISYLCYKRSDLIKDRENALRIVHTNDDFCVGVSKSNDVVFLNPISCDLLKFWKETRGKSFLEANLVVYVREIRTSGQYQHSSTNWNKFIEAVINLKRNKLTPSPVKTNESEDREDVSIKEKDMSDNEEDMESNDESNGDEEISNQEESMEEDLEEELAMSKETTNKKTPTKSENLKRKTVQENLISTKKRKINETAVPKSETSLLAKSSNLETPKDSHSSKADTTIVEKKLKELENLSMDVGDFEWNVSPKDLAKVVARGKMEVVKEDSDEEVEVKKKKKLTPAEKKAAQIEAERVLREKEEELLRCEQNPQSADHFDRLLLTNPNDSKLWIQYMAFHLQGTDIDKARSIARRALKQISVREEKERLNVWIALLNLENTYGSSESFEETLSEALKYNDDFKVYMKVLEMYCETQKVAALDKLTNHLVRKFKDNTNCWYECQLALMKVGLADKARTFLQRCLSSLPKKEHVTIISRFALLENKHGSREQAQTLFENLLTSYPQRVDIWNIYVDMLVKSDCIDLARGVLERITSHKLPIRKMRTIYNKWLQFEEKYGTEKAVESVRKAAEEYVSDLLAPKVKKDVGESIVDDRSGSDSGEDEEIVEEKVNEENVASEDTSDDEDDDSEDDDSDDEEE